MAEKKTETEVVEIPKSVFDILNGVNVNAYTETKDIGGGRSLSYLSWANAFAEVKKRYPDMTYEIKRFENNLPYVYDEKTGYMVFTSVTINGITHEMWLPVLDSNNMAMKSEAYEVTNSYGKSKTIKAATMFDINTSIMRCLTKNLAMFGLGLYIYMGEDLPEIEKTEEQKKKEEELKRPIDATKVKVLKKEIERTGVKEEKILAWCGAAKLEDMDIYAFEKAMNDLQKRPAKAVVDEAKEIFK